MQWWVPNAAQTGTTAGIPPRLVGTETVTPLCTKNNVLAKASGNATKGIAATPASTKSLGATVVAPAAGPDDFKGATAVELTRPAAFGSMSAATEPCQGSWINFTVKTASEWTALSTTGLKDYSNGMMATIRIRLVFAVDYTAGATTKWSANN